MQNHEKGKKRPTYFTIKEKEILWFIPISTKIEKYQKIIDKKIEKYGFCNTILIRKIADQDSAILLQNAFPTLEKYIDHVHTIDGVPLKVPTNLQQEIKSHFKNMLGLKKRGKNLFFSDIDKLKDKMLNELVKQNNKLEQKYSFFVNYIKLSIDNLIMMIYNKYGDGYWTCQK